jgi:hypothetical protein
MDTMNKELIKWRRAYQTYLEKFEDEQSLTTSQLEPLTTELAAVTVLVTFAKLLLHCC